MDNDRVILQIGEATKLLLDHFKDPQKVREWLRAKNPIFGYMTPLQMIAEGRGEKLLKGMRQLLEENKRDQHK